MKERKSPLHAGWDAAWGAGTSVLGAARVDDWLAGVQDAIDLASANLEQLGDHLSNKGEHFLKGDLAERWHEGTFNIDAALRRSRAHATQLGSNERGSPDLLLSGEYGDRVVQSKYYRSADDTAKAVSSPDYEGMDKVVPADQVDGVRQRAQHLADWNRGTRDHQAAQYDHTAKVASGRVEHEGIASRELTEKEALSMAREAKRGELDGARHGLTMDDSIDWQRVAGEAATAAAIAASIGAATAAVPYVVRALRTAIKEGEIDLDALQGGGLAALRGGATGGLRGALAAGIVAAARAGVLGEAMRGISPGAVGAVVAASLSVLGDTWALAQGDLDATEYGKRVAVTSVTSVAAYGGTIVGQALIPVPVVGAMIGGIVGSALGSTGIAGASLALERLDDPVVVQAHIDIARGVAELASTVEDGIVRLDVLLNQRAVFTAGLTARLAIWEELRQQTALDSRAAGVAHGHARDLAEEQDARLLQLLEDDDEN